MEYLLKLAAISAVFFSANSAFAAPVDLSTWIAEGAGTWNVSGSSASVIQTENSSPTIFHNNSNSQGTSLSGSVEVQTTSDDDMVGFVLGYDAGELGGGSSDFWLIDWKQNNQTYSGAYSGRGLALSHVTGDTTTFFPDFWSHSGTLDEKVRGANLGNIGWADNTVYTFDLTFTSTLIEVYVNNVLELSWSAAQNGENFADGAFGFYNYSQEKVEYAGITEAAIVSSVPLPAGLPILLSALGALGLVSRRRKN